MKKEEKRGWQTVWAATALIAVSCLLGFLLQLPGAFGLKGIPYYIVLVILCVIVLAAVYLVVRSFLGKKK